MLLAAARQKSCKSCKILLAHNRVSPAKRKIYKIYKISLAAGEQELPAPLQNHETAVQCAPHRCEVDFPAK